MSNVEGGGELRITVDASNAIEELKKKNAAVKKWEDAWLRSAFHVVTDRLIQRVSRVGSRPTGGQARRSAWGRAFAQGRSSSEFLYRRSGNLAKSVLKTPELEGTAEDRFVKVGFRRGVVDAYAPVHEYGTTRAGIHHNVVIPARAPVHRALEDTRSRIMATLQEDARRSIEGA